MVTTPFGGVANLDVAFAMARQTDGKLVVVGRSGGDGNGQGDGDFALARYNPNGTLDTTFDGDGKVTTDIGTNEGSSDPSDEAHAVVIQPNKKIVVAGIANMSPAAGFRNFALARYNPNGTLDTTFDGDGIVTTDLGTSRDIAWAVTLQEGGEIVVAGERFLDFGLARYNTDGSLDTTFDGDGKVTTGIGNGTFSQADAAHALVQQTDGKLVAAGYAEMDVGGDDTRDFALARYNTDGSLDTTFDGDGIVTTPVSTEPTFNADEVHAIISQPDAKLVVAGESQVDPTNFALARYNTDGSLDTTFDGDGLVTTSVSPIGNTSVAYALALQGGKLVAAGRAANFDPDTEFFHHDFAVARYNSNGSLDTTFDVDGIDTTAVSEVAGAPSGQVDIARAVTVLGNGKALVAGYADMGPPEFIDYDFAVIRYLPNGDARPETTITSGPSGGTTDSTPTFEFVSSDPGSTFECRVDAEAFALCETPYTTPELLGGPHTFEVRAIDAAGNVDLTPAVRSFIVCTILGTSGNDNLVGTGADETICGLAGKDILRGEGGNDQLIGGNDTDTLFGGTGNDTFDGGPGVDTTSFNEAGVTSGVTADLSAGTATSAHLGNDTFTFSGGVATVENLIGTTLVDSLTGNGGANALDGLGGADTLSGLIGTDTLGGGAGADSLNGGTGADSLKPGPGNDPVVDGSGGVDRLLYTDAGAAVTVNLGSGTATGGSGTDSLARIENVTGTTLGDSLTGDGMANELDGAGGPDTLTGLGGNDVLTGGSGGDSLSGGLGADNLKPGLGDDPVVDGGDGIDRVLYTDIIAAGVTVDLGAGTATGGAGSDTLSNIENATGTNLADSLTGSPAANLLDGSGNDDSLDTQDGTSGNDTADGGTGTDACTVDPGDIVLNCP